MTSELLGTRYIVLCVLILFYILCLKFQKNEVLLNRRFSITNKASTTNEIPVVLSFCRDPTQGNQLKDNGRRNWSRQKEQIITLLGSMLYLTYLQKVHVILFVDSESTIGELETLLEKWPNRYRKKLKLEVRYLSKDILENESLNKWRQCSWTKMFLDKLLPEHDSVISLDTDILMLGPVEDFLKEFSHMDDQQAIGCGPELWYTVEHNRDISGKYGLNTGTLLLNLTKLRTHIPEGLGYSMLKIKDFKAPPRHDQDVLNTFLVDKQHLLMELSARYNFIPSSCITLAPECMDCRRKGILALHGADSTFYRDNHLKYKFMYVVWREASKKMVAGLAEIYQDLMSILQQVNDLDTDEQRMCTYLPNFDHYLLFQIKKKVAILTDRDKLIQSTW